MKTILKTKILSCIYKMIKKWKKNDMIIKWFSFKLILIKNNEKASFFIIY